MTMQMRDAMHFEDEVWSLWGITGEGFFEPSEHGLNVEGFRSTACYNGYYGTYHLQDFSLQLLKLEINLDVNTAPALNGRVATQNPEGNFSICGDSTYLDVGLSVPFSGGLMLCSGRTKSRPSGLGPELAWRFERIKELIFENGKLIRTHDHSDAVAKIREGAAESGEFTIDLSAGVNKDDILARYKSLEAKINGCFELDY